MKHFTERVVTLLLVGMLVVLWNVPTGFQPQQQTTEEEELDLQPGDRFFSPRPVELGATMTTSAGGAFDTMVDHSYQLATRHVAAASGKREQLTKKNLRKTHSSSSSLWDLHKVFSFFSHSGGLTDKDRNVLIKLYSQANSVMEYGLGESTKIANAVGVPNYVGIDSDLVWINKVREQVDPRYRFYLADIGPTVKWGFPVQTLDKAVLQYQLVPLIVEQQPFDVYLIDGRWRQACMLASFLHASAMMKKLEQSSSSSLLKTTVLVHDCDREAYHRADHLLSMQRVGDKLCLFRRLPNTTDEDLLKLWNSYQQDQS
jgi:hypothetical protein